MVRKMSQVLPIIFIGDEEREANCRMRLNRFLKIYGDEVRG